MNWGNTHPKISQVNSPLFAPNVKCLKSFHRTSYLFNISEMGPRLQGREKKTLVLVLAMGFNAEKQDRVYWMGVVKYPEAKWQPESFQRLWKCSQISGPSTAFGISKLKESVLFLNRKEDKRVVTEMATLLVIIGRALAISARPPTFC